MKSLISSLILLWSIQTVHGQKQLLATGQFAGSTGFLTFGVTLQNKNSKLQHELLYGFVPHSYGGPLDKITYRFTWLPFKVPLCSKRTWLPFNPVTFVGYNLGKHYSTMPSYRKYDEDYYWWSTAIRLHVGVNTAVRFKNKKGKDLLMVYLEANTNDRYITTYWDNHKNMGLKDLFYLGIGTKASIYGLSD